VNCDQQARGASTVSPHLLSIAALRIWRLRNLHRAGERSKIMGSTLEICDDVRGGRLRYSEPLFWGCP
jgi:hypothetical protein